MVGGKVTLLYILFKVTQKLVAAHADSNKTLLWRRSLATTWTWRRAGTKSPRIVGHSGNREQ